MPTFGEAFGIYNVQDFGWMPDGTDDSAAMLAALAEVSDRGGGILWFPPSTGVYRADQQLLIPTFETASSGLNRQRNISLVGAGCGPKWHDTHEPSGDAGRDPPELASVLDLRYTAGDGNAKIETRGLGNLKIEGLQIQDGGSSNDTPFLHTTNTTLVVRNNTFRGTKNTSQDAIVLGGPSDGTLGNLVGSPFQGYNTIIDGNSFIDLNRGVFGRQYANAVVVQNNTWPYGDCGTRALELSGPSGCYGWTITGNCLEMTKYHIGFWLEGARSCFLAGNGFFDSQGGHNTNYTADIYLTPQASAGAAQFNTIILGYTEWVGGDSTGFVAGPNVGVNTIIGAPVHQLAAPSSYGSLVRLIASASPPDNLVSGDLWRVGDDLFFYNGSATKKISLVDP